MEEVWKDIEGFEGRYQVSNLGNVKSLRYGGRYEVRNLVPKVNNKGYEWVELWKDRKRSCRQIHRLVATAFIPNPDPERYTIINHKDENPRNNRVNNLEWCDYKYNSKYFLDRHRIEFGETISKALKGKAKINRYRIRTKYGVYGPYKHKQSVAQIDKNGNVVKVWDCLSQIVREENKSQWSITQCCEGKRKTAYGYTWRFINAI
jgi:hypothetical protein